jgi:hypothetical protein
VPKTEIDTPIAIVLLSGESSRQVAEDSVGSGASGSETVVVDSIRSDVTEMSSPPGSGY